MAQTDRISHIRLPKGCRVSADNNDGSGYYDLGIIMSTVEAVLQWDENVIDGANYEEAVTQVRNLRVEGSFTMGNLDPDGILKLGGGIFEKVEVDGTALSDIKDQIIAANWNDNVKYPLIMDSTANGEIKTTAKPTLTSVKLDAAGTTPETLTEDNDYVIVADSMSNSGWSIQFISANMSTGTPKTKAITIDYGTNTPLASTIMYAGNPSETLSPFKLKFEVYSDAGVVEDSFEIFKNKCSAGAFAFSYKGIRDDGLDEMPISFVGKCDNTRTANRQLMAWQKYA